MRDTVQRIAAIAGGVIISVGLLAAGPARAKSLETPVVQGSWGTKLLTIRWGGVAGASYYRVGILGGNVQGPVAPSIKVNGTSYSFAYGSDDFPTTNYGARVVVVAYAKDGSHSAYKEVRVHGHTVGSSVQVSKGSDAVSQKISSCLGKGLAAGATTAAGSAVAAVVTSWVPFLGEVTVGGAVLATVGAAGGAFVTCLK